MKKTLLCVNLLLVWLACADGPSITGVTAHQRYPWNGKVDVSYTVSGDIVSTANARGVVPCLKVTAVNMAANTTNTAASLSGDVSLAAGTHTVVWDMEADALSFKSDDVVFSVSCESRPATYCVIDISAGASASSYPVSYLAEPPSSGFNVNEYKTTKLVLRRIEPGSFKMCGQYDVTLTNPYYIGMFEVTQKQFALVMGTNPSYYKGNLRPAECVSWQSIRGDACGFSNSCFLKLLMTRAVSGTFDLPTEAQWEYACRAGTTSSYNNGGNDENDLNGLGRYAGNTSDGKGGYAEHTKVGCYQPNAWGLYDMHGNVFEWCRDGYGSLSSGVTNPTVAVSASLSSLVVRGGAYTCSASSCASSYRTSRSSISSTEIGFRIAKTLSDSANEVVICACESVPVAIDLTEGIRTASVVPMRYCVIDLSAGANASSYPVTYMNEPPSGGFNVDEYKTTKLVLRRIEPGSFKMCGQYDVTLTKPFYMGMFEVTQKQYELVYGSNPSALKGDTRPVEYVSWNIIRGDSSTYDWPNSTDVDPSTFVGRLQSRTGLNIDLPTEAQWEYACRAGTTNAYNNGGSSTNDLKKLGRYGGNCTDGKGGYSEHTTVGSYLPNEWGLYDMHGNVWERLLDWFGESLVNGAIDPAGPASGVDSPSGQDRAVRGGSWHGTADYCDSSHRDCCRPGVGNRYYGFRLARTLQDSAGAEIPPAGESPFAVVERIRYSSEWVDGAPAGAVAVVEVNGVEISSAAGSGFVDWTPASNGIYRIAHKVMANGEQFGETQTALVLVQGMRDGYTATQTTEVPVPYVWLLHYDPCMANEYEAYEAAAKATAANGRNKVWECYVLGLDPTNAVNGFRIASFRLLPDNTPDLEALLSSIDPPRAKWNVPDAVPVIKGATNLADEIWSEVTDQNKAPFRFFKVTVELP